VGRGAISLFQGKDNRSDFSDVNSGGGEKGGGEKKSKWGAYQLINSLCKYKIKKKKKRKNWGGATAGK